MAKRRRGGARRAGVQEIIDVEKEERQASTSGWDGLQLMGWLTGSEISPLAVRSAGTAAQSATLWSTNLLITLTLLTMIDGIGVGETFWVYAAFNVAAFIFVYLKMPEFTGRSLEQIEGSLRQGHFEPKDFERRTVAEVPA